MDYISLVSAHARKLAHSVTSPLHRKTAFCDDLDRAGTLDRVRFDSSEILVLLRIMQALQIVEIVFYPFGTTAQCRPRRFAVPLHRKRVAVSCNTQSIPAKPRLFAMQNPSQNALVELCAVAVLFPQFFNSSTPYRVEAPLCCLACHNTFIVQFSRYDPQPLKPD